MFHKFLPIFIIFSIVILLSSAITSSKQWFFFRTGQQDINKMGLSGEYQYEAHTAEYEGEDIKIPPFNKLNTQLVQILGETVNENKRIEVDLSHQKLYAY